VEEYHYFAMRMALILAGLLSTSCRQDPIDGLRSPWVEEVKLADKKEDVSLLSVHCVAWAQGEDLGVAAKAQVEDFGPSTGTVVVLKWDFGDGTVVDESMSRPGFPSGRPVQYRFGTHQAHRYKSPGSYVVRLTVSNGARQADCSMSTTVVPQSQHRDHPQG
jgi:PKD domain-containing protein